MNAFTFVTGNALKIEHARFSCGTFDIDFDVKDMPIVEIQADDGEAIARSKADQAFAKFQRPVVITDDSWLIPGLKGFPGPYMKYINEWFSADDFLRLTINIKDRRIVKRQVIVYKDSSREKIFIVDTEGTLLKESRGESIYTHLTIATYDGINSLAETIDGRARASSNHGAWEDLCAWLHEPDKS